MKRLFAFGVLLVGISAFEQEGCGPRGRCRDVFFQIEMIRELQHMSMKTNIPTPSPAYEGSLRTNAPATLPAPTSVPLAPPGKCTSIDGFFGDVSGEQSVYQFVYELETFPEEGVSIEYDVLPPLEVAFNNYLLSALFPDLCGEPVRRRRASRSATRAQSRRLKIQGISARPDDTIQQGKACSYVESEGDVCNVIRGELTLFTDSATARFLNEDELISQTLQEGMTNGSFLSASPSIRRVSFVDGGMDDNTDPGTEGDKGPGSTESSNGNGLLVGSVVAGAGALMVIAGIVACRRRNGEGAEDLDQTATFMQDNVAPVLVEGTGAASRKPVFIDEASVDASIYHDKSSDVSDVQSELLEQVGDEASVDASIYHDKSSDSELMEQVGVPSMEDTDCSDEGVADQQTM